MRNAFFTKLINFTMFLALASLSHAEMVTKDEALTVATNWITTIIHHNGSWGGHKKATVQEIQEFKRDGRTIGFFCPVMPNGYILVSLLKELAPVKAYSSISDLNPDSDGGMTDLLKGKMAGIINTIEWKLGAIETLERKDMESILEIDYITSWDKLNRDCADFTEELEAGLIMTDYEGNDSTFLLTSYWDQHDPYNEDCPAPPGGDDCTAAHCLVGCVATACSQIMHYWNWPPFGEGGGDYSDTYAWLFIPDTLDGSSTTEQINATAELCHEVGVACTMDYCGDNTDGCSSGTQTWYVEFALEENFRYTTSCSKRDRIDYTPTEWFDLLKEDLNKNQPLEYRIKGHAIVCDGWQIVDGDKEYHMNYGWANSRNTWYTLDVLHQVDSMGCADSEYVMQEIRPTPSIGGAFSGTYNRDASFIYRYFTRNATCATDASFGIGQRLQFLPHIEVKCATSSTGHVQFNGSAVSGYDNWLYSINNEDQKVGIRIYDGAVRLCENGGIRFHGE